MCRVSKITGFLVLNENWDPTLMFVMLSAVSINLVTFHKILNSGKPVYAEKFGVPSPTSRVDTRLVVGAATFGCGWGLSGICPGPGVVIFFMVTHASFWILGLILG